MLASNQREALVTCPYNKAHTISQGRYSNHVIRCRKNNPDKVRDVAVCRFDANHILPRVEIPCHEEHCSARMSLELQLVQLNIDNSAVEGRFDPRTMIDDVGECTEDWESEADFAGYSGKSEVVSTTQLALLTPAEKRAFHKSLFTNPQNKLYPDEIEDDYTNKAAQPTFPAKQKEVNSLAAPVVNRVPNSAPRVATEGGRLGIGRGGGHAVGLGRGVNTQSAAKMLQINRGRGRHPQ